MFHGILPRLWCLLAARRICGAAVPAALAGETPAPQLDLFLHETNSQQGFLNPPASAKPSVYWWWLFNRIDKKGITRDLEEFKAKGIGGVNLICTGGYAGDHPLPGVKFLGPEWRELFRHAVQRSGAAEDRNRASTWPAAGS